MFNYHSGNKVKGGFYWSVKGWDIATIPHEGGVLPGNDEHRYIKVPMLLLCVLAPVMGLLYVMFLPFIGFAFMLGLAGKKAAMALSRSAGHAELELKSFAESNAIRDLWAAEAVEEEAEEAVEEEAAAAAEEEEEEVQAIEL